MASRDEASFDGIRAERTTYPSDGSIVYDITKAGGSVSVGLAVKMASAGVVGLTTDGSNFRGKLIKVESDGMCSVQDEGFCEVIAGVGVVSIPVGSKLVGALGGVGGAMPGYVRAVVAPGGAYSQAGDVEALLGNGFVIDGSDPDAVIVDL